MTIQHVMKLGKLNPTNTEIEIHFTIKGVSVSKKGNTLVGRKGTKILLTARIVATEQVNCIRGNVTIALVNTSTHEIAHEQQLVSSDRATHWSVQMPTVPEYFYLQLQSPHLLTIDVSGLRHDENENKWYWQNHKPYQVYIEGKSKEFTLFGQ
jgi:hypothetical protein